MCENNVKTKSGKYGDYAKKPTVENSEKSC